MATLSVFAKLGLDKTGFDAALNNAGKKVSKFGGDLKSQLAGAFTFGAVLQFARNLEQTIGRIKDLSEQFGITTDEVQNTDFALKQSGLQFEDLTSAMQKLGAARKEAVVEGGELREVFQRYGLTLEDLNNPQLRTYDLLLKLSAGMANQNITAREQSQILELIGPRAVKLVNVLQQLETIKPPVIFEEGDIERIDQMSKSLENLVTLIQATVAPVVVGFAENFRKAIESARSGDFLGFMSRINPLNAIPQVAGGIAQARVEAERENTRKFLDKIIAEELDSGQAGPGLWDPDSGKKVKTIKEVAQTIQSDQFQRIGAFTGQSAEAAQNDLLRRQLSTLERLRDDLIRRGIIVRGTD